MEILTVKNLSFSYPQTGKKVLDNISFSVNEGDFIAVCGATGCGKSTLLRLLKRELAPLGETDGEMCFYGEELSRLDARTSASAIGFVMQRPEQQLVTDKVWHELAVGLENLGVPSPAIRRRVAEMSGYFGISDWFDKNVAELSGGQKQLLNLASVMAMSPRLLILDEPTAQLDPIAASEFINTLIKLNRELSLTIIIAEHRLEEIIPACDRLIALENGRLAADAEPRLAASKLCAKSGFDAMMPVAVRLHHALGSAGECALTIREGRRLLEHSCKNDIRELPRRTAASKASVALEFDDVYFRYTRDGGDVLRGTSFKVREGELYCILGANGSGKTTVLGAAAALNRIYSGKIRVFGKALRDYKDGSLYLNCLAWLPQDPQTLFLRNTVREELAGAETEAERVGFDLRRLGNSHSYDLSGGEQQLAALARVLAAKPRLLLLDEPTKGLDAAAKSRIADVLRKLRDEGMTIITVTHDAEFAAAAADRCALFFRGEVVSEGEPAAFFSENNFYTTAANRMTRGYFDRVVTLEETLELCALNGANVRRESEAMQ